MKPRICYLDFDVVFSYVVVVVVVVVVVFA